MMFPSIDLRKPQKATAMKKIQLSIILTVVWFASYAQFDNARYVLGGTVDFSYDDDAYDDFYKRSSFSITPSVAKPLNNQTLVGIDLGFTVGSSKFTNDNATSKSNSISYNPAVFYQKFYPVTDKIFFNWQAKATVGFLKSVNEDEFAKITERSTSYSLRVGPGISWKVMDRVLLNGSIGGVSFGFTDRETGSSTFFGASFNNPHFGFSFLLN